MTFPIWSLLVVHLACNKPAQIIFKGSVLGVEVQPGMSPEKDS